STLCPGPVETGFAEAAGFGELEAGDSLPKFMWVSAHDVAKAGIEGLDRGRDVIIPGGANRVMAGVAHVIPHRLLLPVLAKQHPSL
ncbi:MAG: SDR family NAD(P)-dependent oxidoreductase, partial [Acidimicrobiales bacterium]